MRRRSPDTGPTASASTPRAQVTRSRSRARVRHPTAQSHGDQARSQSCRRFRSARTVRPTRACPQTAPCPVDLTRARHRRPNGGKRRRPLSPRRKPLALPRGKSKPRHRRDRRRCPSARPASQDRGLAAALRAQRNLRCRRSGRSHRKRPPCARRRRQRPWPHRVPRHPPRGQRRPCHRQTRNRPRRRNAQRHRQPRALHRPQRRRPLLVHRHMPERPRRQTQRRLSAHR